MLFDGRKVEVAEIVDRWFAPDYRYFKLRDVRDHLWIVRHDEATGEWELTMYERSPQMLADQAPRAKGTT